MDISMAKLKVTQLQALLRANGLPIHYRRKTELVTRIKSHARKNIRLMGTDEQFGGGGDAGASGSGSGKSGASGAVGAAGASGAGAGSSSADGARGVGGAQAEARSVFAFRDVEDSLTKYSGEEDVGVWLDGFEEVADTCAWSAVQRYVYGRRLLRGAAKLAVESSVGVNSWELLGELLRTEFAVELSGREIHNRLRNRTKLPTESLTEYAYQMRKIGNLGDIDEKSLLDYIVAGVPDDAVNKTIMYAANTFATLKRSFVVYETIKEAQKPAFAQKETGGAVENAVWADAAAISPRVQRRRCGLCGGLGHESAVCPNMEKGPKCFKCTAFGHISTNCPTNIAGAPNSSAQVAVEVGTVEGAVACDLPDMHVHAGVFDQKLVALVDTGSDVTILKETIYGRLPGPPAFDGPPITLRTLGNVVQRSSGSFRAPVDIDGQVFVVSCQVLPDALMVGDMMLGRNLLRCASMSVIDGRVEIVKRLDVVCDNVNALASMNVQTLVADADKNTRVRYYTIIDNSIVRQQVMNKRNNDKCVFRPPRPRDFSYVANDIDASPSYASPIVVTRNKVGSARLSVEIRAVNENSSELFEKQERFESDRCVASPTMTCVPHGEVPAERMRAKMAIVAVIDAAAARSTVRTPFEWLVGVKMRSTDENRVLDVAFEQENAQFEGDRLEVGAEANRRSDVQKNNRRTYDRERKEASRVAIEKMQCSGGANEWAPYDVVQVIRNDFVSQKTRDEPGPISMTSAANFIKPWVEYTESSGAYELCQDRPSVGLVQGPMR